MLPAPERIVIWFEGYFISKSPSQNYKFCGSCAVKQSSSHFYAWENDLNKNASKPPIRSMWSNWSNQKRAPFLCFFWYSHCMVLVYLYISVLIVWPKWIVVYGMRPTRRPWKDCFLRCAIHDPLESGTVANFKDGGCENKGSRIEFRVWMS